MNKILKKAALVLAMVLLISAVSGCESTATTTKGSTAASASSTVAAGIKNANKIVNGDLASSELGVKAIDASTLEVQLEAVVPYFLSTLIRPAFLPINQKYFEKVGVKYGMNPQTTIYNGPYVWSGWDYATNIQAKTDWGTSTAKIAKELIALKNAEGLKLVAHEEVVEGSDDYSPSITKLKEAGAEVVMCVGMYSLVAPVAKQYNQLCWRLRWLKRDAWT